MRSRWTFGPRILAFLAVLALLAAACGDDDGETGPTTTGGGEEGGEADPNGVVRQAYELVARSVTLDPAEASTAITDSGLYYLVYGGLLRRTVEGELEPDLAESTELTDENTIEVTLREGLSFSDGEPFDADAVKAGLERTLAKTDSPALGATFFELETIEVTSPTTLTLTVPSGTAASWHDTYMGSWETTIVQPDADFSQPPGAGPMRVKEFTPETRIVLEKNPEYWDAESVRVGGVELIHVPDAQAGVAALGAGQVDMTLIEPALIAALPSNAETVVTPDPDALSSLAVCKRDEPLSDPLVRQALNKAVDREAINEAVFGGTYQPAHGLWPDDHRFHNPDVNEAVEYDPEGAEELLAEAGYEDGVEFDLYVIQSGNMPEVAEILQQQYEEIGVTANLLVRPTGAYLAEFLQAESPGAGAIPVMEGGRGKLNQWVGETLGNTCSYDDPELNELRDRLTAVSDSSDEAVDIWHQIEEKVVAEDTLGVFLLFGARAAAYDADRLGAAALTPHRLFVPDVRQTFVKAGG